MRIKVYVKEDNYGKYFIWGAYNNNSQTIDSGHNLTTDTNPSDTVIQWLKQFLNNHENQTEIGR